jgi:phospholipid/cholesterol/gamma-HCH transport system permease protein
MTTFIFKKSRSLVEDFGDFLIKTIDDLGNFCNFSLRFVYWVFKKPFRFNILWEQFYFIGNKSLFIILLAGSFTGMVLAYQTYFGFQLISVDSLVGPVVALSMAKELAPVLTGLIVSGRAGSAMAAQIGTMKVTEQIDALEVMGISSVQYLAVPRILASTFCLPMLAAIFLFIGNAGAWFIGTQVLMIDESLYFSKLHEFVFMTDLMQGLIKSLFFGLAIALIGTYFGFQVEKGAEGVGRGTNLAVVWGMITVLILDFFLTSFLIRIL